MLRALLLLLLPDALAGVVGALDDARGAAAAAAPSLPAPASGPGAAPLLPAAPPSSPDPLCAAPQPGFLSVATTPWTSVVVDGARVGTTPLFRLPLAPGAHVVDFVNERYGVVAREAIVVGEAELRKLKLVFLTASHPEAALNESRAEEPRDEADCVTTEGEIAFLSVDVKPWARVFVDGRAVGTTPLFRHGLRPGGHRVRLQGPHGEHAASRFDAAADETVKLSLTFVAPPSLVGDGPPAVDADVDDADLDVDDADLGAADALRAP